MREGAQSGETGGAGPGGAGRARPVEGPWNAGGAGPGGAGLGGAVPVSGGGGHWKGEAGGACGGGEADNE